MRQSGFTLIELLVVMVLLGLLFGVVVTSIGGNQARELEIESNRLHAMLRTAANEAVFTNTEIGMQISDGGYQFITYNEEEAAWQLASSEILRPQTLPDWMYLEFEREGELVELPSNSSQDREFGAESEAVKPDFMLLSSGEVSDFTLTLGLRDDSELYRQITLNEFGEIVLPHLEEDEF